MRAKIVSIFLPKSNEPAVTVTAEDGRGNSYDFNDYTVETAKKFTIGAEVEIIIALTTVSQ